VSDGVTTPRGLGPSDAPERRVFHTLDALRGIAAIGVVSFHMRAQFEPLSAPGGYLAVDLFFMMSGVVLSHAYEGRFQAGMGTFDFMRARLIRLYPLYLLGTLFGIAVTLASLHGRNTQHWDPSSLSWTALLALFGLPNISSTPVNEMFPLDIPCWSLFLEILVNLLFVVFWPLLASRRLLVLCVLTGALVLLAVAHQGNLDLGSIPATFPVGLARSVFGFSVGVLIARQSRHAPRAQSNVQVLSLGAVAVAAIIAWPGGDLRAVWDATCVLVVFPVAVYWATRVDPGPRLRVIATFLGVTSYAVYVLHSPLSSVMNSATRYFAAGSAPGFGAPYIGLAILAVLLIGCWLIDRYYDAPIRRQLSRLVPTRQPR
jgi:peptidoglycan/LPS O-acetylase OafA/YrhL